MSISQNAVEPLVTYATQLCDSARPDPYSQQRLLAEFGSHALRSDDLDSLLERACRMAAEGLGQDYCKIVRYQDEKLVVVASYGYDLKPEDMVLNKADGTSAGHALESGTPTVSGDVVADQRFERATIERGEAIRSVLNVPIPDIGEQGGTWYGVIEVDSPDVGAFRDEEIAFLQLYADLLASAIGRQRTQDRLEALVADKARLLQELQHRVKNNLGIISSLTRMQGRKASSPDVRSHLSAIEQRIETLRLVHETLYSDGGSNEVALHTYLDDLATNLTALVASDVGNERVRFETAFDPLTLNVDYAIPLGLILNEFVTNALKYAFADRAGRIAMTLNRHGREAELILSDNGPGLPDDPERGSGTGMVLIGGLASQIDATVDWTGLPGTTLTVRFPLPDTED